MTTSDWIQLATLAVVLAYTFVTYLLLRQQKIQFEKSIRPWVCTGDITYNKRLVIPELAIILYNIGRIPAQCTISVDRLSITQQFGEKIELLNKDEVRNFPIFPYVEGTDSVHMFLLNLTEEQSILLTDDCRLECHLKIGYRRVDDAKTDETYLYEANLLVEQFKEDKKKQTTLINVLVAT